MPSLLLLALLTLAAPMQSVEETELRVDTTSERLVEVIKEGLRKTEPSANVVRRKTGETLFDGSYDWHSNLFAHWALLTHARENDDEELRQWVLEPLTDEALDQERARLAEVETERLATFPYDQAWLLLLLAEIPRHRDVSETTSDFRLEVETRLIDWLAEAKFPENDNPKVLDGRGIIGWYRSWAFTWYQVMRSEPIGDGALERLRALRRERVDPVLPTLLRPEEPFPFEFLWVPTLAYLIDDVDPFETELPPYELGKLDSLPEDVDLSTTHLLGVHLSRLWPLAIAARESSEARAELERELAHYMERDDLWRGDFQVISHWTPQFLWFALWLSREEA